MSEQLTRMLERAVEQGPTSDLTGEKVLAAGRGRVRRRRAVGAGAAVAAAAVAGVIWLGAVSGLPTMSTPDPAGPPAEQVLGGELQLVTEGSGLVARLDGDQLDVAEGTRTDGVWAWDLPDGEVLLVVDEPVDGSGSTGLLPVLQSADGPQVRSDVVLDELALDVDGRPRPAVVLDVGDGQVVGAVLADADAEGQEAVLLVGPEGSTVEIDEQVFVSYVEGSGLWLAHRGEGSGPVQVADRSGAIAVEVAGGSSLLVAAVDAPAVEPRVVGTSGADGGGGAMNADETGPNVIYFGVDSPPGSLLSPEVGLSLDGGTGVDVPVVGVLPLAADPAPAEPGLGGVEVTATGDGLRATRGGTMLAEIEVPGEGVWAWEDGDGIVVTAEVPDLHPTAQLQPVLRFLGPMRGGGDEPLVLPPSSLLESGTITVGEERWPAVWVPRSEQEELAGALLTNAQIFDETVRVLGGDDVSPELPLEGRVGVAAAAGIDTWAVYTSADMPTILDGPSLVAVQAEGEVWDLVARLPGSDVDPVIVPVDDGMTVQQPLGEVTEIGGHRWWSLTVQAPGIDDLRDRLTGLDTDGDGETDLPLALFMPQQ